MKKEEILAFGHVHAPDLTPKREYVTVKPNLPLLPTSEVSDHVKEEMQDAKRSRRSASAYAVANVLRGVDEAERNITWSLVTTMREAEVIEIED